MSEAIQRNLSRRNFALGLINGALFILLATFIDVDTVVPGFAWQLTGGKTIFVGVLISVINMGWFWPQLLLSSTFATADRLMPWYWLSALTRGVALFALAAVAWYLDAFTPWLGFVLIAAMYVLYSSGGGLSIIPFMSVVADSIPPNWRGKFFGARYLVGGMMALVAGAWIRWLLSDQSGLAFPRNYAWMFLIGAIVATPSLLSWCFAREPARPVQRRRVAVPVELRRGLRLLRRDSNFRRLLITRSLSTITLGLTLPFIVPYALSQLRVPAAAVGLFVTSKIITYSLSNLLWSRVSDEGGNRRLLLLSGFMTIGALALVLSVRMLPTDHLVTIAGINVTWRVAFLCLIFAAFGFSNAGQEIGYTNFLLELIPERKRSVYMGIFYAAISPLCWVPFFGSLAIGTGGRFVMGFSIAAVLALAMMRYTFRLREVREFEGDGNGEN
ncbi:MAG: hypothetical protein ABFD96_12035 [Armatimonadia bacterium]